MLRIFFAMSMGVFALRLEGQNKAFELPLAGGRIHHLFSKNGVNDKRFHALRPLIFEAVRTPSSPNQSLMIGLGNSGEEALIDNTAQTHNWHVIEVFAEFIGSWQQHHPDLHNHVSFTNAAACETGQTVTITYHGDETTVQCVSPSDVTADPLFMTSIDADGACLSCMLKLMAQTKHSNVEMFFIELLDKPGDDNLATLELLDSMGYTLFSVLTVGMQKNENARAYLTPQEDIQTWPQTPLAHSSSLADFIQVHLRDATHLAPKWTDIIAVRRDLVTQDVIATFSRMTPE